MTKASLALMTILALGVSAVAQTPSTAAKPKPAPKTAASASATKKAPTAAKKPVAKGPASTVTLKTQRDKASYAVGMNFGKSLHAQSVDVDPAIVAQGLKDAMAGNKPLLTDDEARAALTELKNEVMAHAEAKANEAAAANKKEGEAFLAANKAKPGVVTLPDGLQYKVISEGSGPKPAATDTVVCNYRGTLINGTEFDSSYKHGEPISFAVNGVIKGWTEALQLMPVGSKWQLFIPSDLAYGNRGAGSDIGPGATLIFEVELLSIKGK